MEMENPNTFDLIAAARAKFGELSAAEEKVLRAVHSGEIAYCGPSDKDDDPANDPANAATWGNDRSVRAKLIRWICVDAEAGDHIEPHGVRIHGARIGNVADEASLDLEGATIPFPIYFLFCKLEVALVLYDARIEVLGLAGSHLPELRGDRLTLAGSLLLRDGFRLEGEARLIGAEIGGQLVVRNARFGGASRILLENATIKEAFFWTDIEQHSSVTLDLMHASVGPLGDDESSWPKKGNLHLDGFTYQRIGAGPTDAKKRLDWLSRQPGGFFPQSFKQLAKVLREAGDDAGARDVLIAMENARLKHGKLGRFQRVVRWILRATVGYGYKPFRALGWIVGFILLGTVLFSWGRMANVVLPVERKAPAFNAFIYSLENFLPLVDLHMAKYWMPDPNATPSALDWPGSDSPAPTPFNLGAYLRWYLWLHILLGWFFSSMFIAGVTGLVRRE
jgi:hypothetical protein